MPRFSLRAIAFDLDGTLVDAFTDLTTAINRARTHYGMAPMTVAEVRQHVGLGTRTLVSSTVPNAPDGLDAAHARFAAAYERCLLDTTQAYPGAEAVLDGLSRLPIALVTNKNQRHTEMILDGLGWRGRFALVIGGDALPAKKPDPMPLRHVLKQFACSPDAAAMVGDGVVDIEAGRGAGMITVGVSYGNTAAEILAGAQPDALIDALPELLHLIHV